VRPATGPAGGRPRDQELDQAILSATIALLNESGIEAATIAAIAERAGTTRPALYRRYSSQAELVIAALHTIARLERPTPTGDHRHDLEQELRGFRDAAQRTNSIALVGSMLVDSTDPEIRAYYRRLIVQPRRAAITGILEAARSDGSLTCSPGDLDATVTMCTGSYYAYALAGKQPPRDWPKRIASLIWRACGGTAAD
jgi:AcrR family transcriptional regulator